MRRISSLLCLVVISFLCFQFEDVDGLYVLPYWYSTGNHIMNYDAETVYYTVEVQQDCDMHPNAMNAYINSAEQEWDDLYEIDFIKSTSINTIDIDCISRTIATQLGASANATGLAILSYYASPYAMYSKPQGGTAYFHEAAGADIYLIWDDSGSGTVKTSEFSYNDWFNVSMHEFGHAIGYADHSMYDTQLMYWSPTACYSTVTSYDYYQMLLVYPSE